MTEYRIQLIATDIAGERWLSANQFDYDYACGVKDLKFLLSEIKEAKKNCGIEIDYIWKYMPHGCYEDVTEFYKKYI